MYSNNMRGMCLYSQFFRCFAIFMNCFRFDHCSVMLSADLLTNETQFLELSPLDFIQRERLLLHYGLWIAIFLFVFYYIFLINILCCRWPSAGPVIMRYNFLQYSFTFPPMEVCFNIC